MEISNDLQHQVMTSYPLNEVSPYQLNQELNPSLQFQSQSHQALRCPRCDSINTKFCYYNNYSLSQPRYFCKSCRRYWTKGGSLRNVPVGGGCRKSKKSSSSLSSSKKLTLSQDNPNLNPGYDFFDILRSGIESQFYGFGGENPFGNGVLDAVRNSTTAATTSSACTKSHGGNLNGNFSWNGFINGLSDEIHDGDI